MKRHYFLLPVFLFLTDVAADTNHITSIQVGRYSSISTEPTLAQKDLLSSIVEVTFPTGITTVNDALNSLLLNSGYAMAKLSASDPKLPILLKQSLPLVHRTLGPITLRRALEALAGTPWELVVDPVNRLVSFELTRAFVTNSQ